MNYPAVPNASGWNIFALAGINKSFGAAQVLHDVSIEFRSGEVHALLGENGAGKSTIAKIIAGAITQDSGVTSIDANEVHLSSPSIAQENGVTMIFQEPMLFPDLSIAENIFIGRQPRKVGRPWLDKREMSSAAGNLLEEIGLRLDPSRLVRGMSVAEMQMVEIATAMSHDTRLLVVDEPTASLTPSEVSHLFDLFRSLCSRGASVLFIGHRLEEVFEIADRITVLRDGHVIDTKPTTEFDEASLIQAMVGRPQQELLQRKGMSQVGDVVLKVNGLGRSGVFKDVTFEVRSGEVVGIAGLVGAGRSEIARVVFGIDRPDAGFVEVVGQRIPAVRPDLSIRAGLALVSEDRKGEGLADRLPINQNISIILKSVVGRFGWLRKDVERQVVGEFLKRLDVRARSANQPVSELSGGNQQKVVLAKWLATNPKVLILDEPTRGVDVGAKEEIHHLIDGLASDGLGVLVISSDLPEVLALSDRILVVREGRLVGELQRGATAEQVIELAVGIDERTDGVLEK